MTSLLEKSIKSSRISFETALSYFMVVLGAISEDPHQVGTKSTDEHLPRFLPTVVSADGHKESTAVSSGRLLP